MRENRPCGSEGGEGVTPFRPLSATRSQLVAVLGAYEICLGLRQARA